MPILGTGAPQAMNVTGRSSTVSGGGGGSSSQQSSSASQSSNAAQASNFSQSYIPDYAESPILRSIALQAQSMAPEVYQWGMQQFENNKGNIDGMMRDALTYASPSRIKASMGAAQAGVMQGAEAGRQNAIKDLQSFGVDPSSGRYAALDKASQVMAGAQAAGAGNLQRDRDIATGTSMRQAATDASLKNVQTGYGASGAANALLGTAIQLKYPPLGNVSGGQSSSQGTSSNTQQSSGSSSTNPNFSVSSSNQYAPSTEPFYPVANATPGFSNPQHFAAGGGVDDSATTGGFVSQEMSPSAGAQTDDVQARLNTGEFVIPKDVAQWKGQEFFYKLMAQARQLRARAGSEGAGSAAGGGDAVTGYAGGGEVDWRYMKPDQRIQGTLDAGGPAYNSGGAGKPTAQATNDPNKSYRENTPPRMGWWGKEPGNPHEQTPDIRQYPELYGGTRGGWRPWENPGDIGYAWGRYTQPLDPQSGQPNLNYQGGGVVGESDELVKGFNPLGGAVDKYGNPLYDVIGSRGAITHRPSGFETPGVIGRGAADPFMVRGMD